MRRLLAVLAALILAALPARADFGAGGQLMGFWFDSRCNEPAFSLTFIAATVSTTNTTSYNFASQSLGTADCSRYIIVSIGTKGTTTPTVSAVTVDGMAASQVVTVTNTLNTDTSASIWIAPAPGTATTGTIAVTTTNTATGMGIATWRMVGGNPTATSTGTDITESSNNYSATLVIPTGGAGIGYFTHGNTNTARTTAWTNLTEAFDGVVDGTDIQDHSGARSTTAGSATRTAQISSSNGSGAGSLVLAAWGP
jgi:hypothetical protein